MDITWRYTVFFLLLNFNSYNQFQSIVEFHIDSSHLICTANQMTGFYMKQNIGLNSITWCCFNSEQVFATYLFGPNRSLAIVLFAKLTTWSYQSLFILSYAEETHRKKVKGKHIWKVNRLFTLRKICCR